MKVKVENIEMVITHNDIDYQVGAVWIGSDSTEDTYEIYYYKLGETSPDIFKWIVNSSGGLVDERYLDAELSGDIMDILFNEDNPMIKEF
jgi:hypothetical protein